LSKLGSLISKIGQYAVKFIPVTKKENISEGNSYLARKDNKKS